MAPLIDARAAAERLGVKATTVLEHARAGKYPAGVVVKHGRLVRFNSEELDRWIRAGGDLAPAPDSKLKAVQ